MNNEQEKNQASGVNEADRITKLMNFSGELVTLKGQYSLLSRQIEKTLKESRNLKELEEHVRTLNGLNSSLSKIAADIQSGVMQIRMTPIKGIFDMIHENLNHQKGFFFNSLGEETEIDHNVYEQLKDPLAQLIEALVSIPSVSNQTGEERQLFLRAQLKGNYVSIEIADEPNALDLDQLIDQFELKGISFAQDRDNMSFAEKGEAVMSQDDWTGVGSQAVQNFIIQLKNIKNLVEQFHGNVVFGSEHAHMISVVMTVPLSLSIYKTLLVKIGESVYAIPIASVMEIINIQGEDLYTVDGNDTIKLRGHALSLIDLHKVIGLAENKGNAQTNRKVVVISDGEKNVGIFVNTLIGEEDIVIKPLADHYSNVKGINGASILGDGSIALVLNPVSILSTAQQGVAVRG